MRLGLFFGAVFIYLVGLFIASTGQTKTMECNSSTVLELIVNEDCPECPPPPDCPPVLACEAGYECQPIANGEQQQYPPERAAAWVVSLGCTGLTDVAIDDSRWGNREEGEVYAREGDGCLSLYWPGDGDALFDISTVISNPGSWHDYRFSVGGQPRGGDYQVRTGKESIHFNDGGSGGMTVFKSDDGVIPPPPAGGFLSNYINPKREALPADKIYPIGQKAHLSAWNPGTVNDVQMLFDNGFTTIGPFENAWPSSNKNLKAMYQKAKDLGMRAWTYMHPGSDGGVVWKVCRALNAGKSHQEIMQGMVNLWNAHYSKEPYNSITDAFVLLPEELASRLNKCDTNKLLAYDNAVIDKIKSLTGGKRPIIRTEVEGNGYANIARADRRVGVAAQHYFEKHGQSGYYKHAAIIQVRARGYLAYMASLDQNHPLDKPRSRIVLPGAIYEPTDKSVAGTQKYTDYYIWTNAIQGVTGFSIYKLDKNVAGGNLKRAFIKTIKQFTEHGFDQAFLWGNKKPAIPLTFTRVSGPSNANFSIYKAESMLAGERQFGDKRYIAITNSHWDQSIGVRISGLPVGGYKLHDIKTGKAQTITSTTKRISIEPLGVRAYKISK